MASRPLALLVARRRELCRSDARDGRRRCRARRRGRGARRCRSRASCCGSGPGSTPRKARGCPAACSPTCASPSARRSRSTRRRASATRCSCSPSPATPAEAKAHRAHVAHAPRGAARRRRARVARPRERAPSASRSRTTATVQPLHRAVRGSRDAHGVRPQREASVDFDKMLTTAAGVEMRIVRPRPAARGSSRPPRRCPSRRRKEIAKALEATPGIRYADAGPPRCARTPRITTRTTRTTSRATCGTSTTRCTAATTASTPRTRGRSPSARARSSRRSSTPGSSRIPTSTGRVIPGYDFITDPDARATATRATRTRRTGATTAEPTNAATSRRQQLARLARRGHVRCGRRQRLRHRRGRLARAHPAGPRARPRAARGRPSTSPRGCCGRRAARSRACRRTRRRRASSTCRSAARASASAFEQAALRRGAVARRAGRRRRPATRTTTPTCTRRRAATACRRSSPPIPTATARATATTACTPTSRRPAATSRAIRRDAMLSTVDESTGAPSGDYVFDFKNGTSMAAPHVTGVGALMLSVNPSLTPAQMKGIMADTSSYFASRLGVPHRLRLRRRHRQRVLRGARVDPDAERAEGRGDRVLQRLAQPLLHRRRVAARRAGARQRRDPGLGAHRRHVQRVRGRRIRPRRRVPVLHSAGEGQLAFLLGVGRRVQRDLRRRLQPGEPGARDLRRVHVRDRGARSSSTCRSTAPARRRACRCGACGTTASTPTTATRPACSSAARCSRKATSTRASSMCALP